MILNLILMTILSPIVSCTSVNITCKPIIYNYDHPDVECCKINGDFIVSSEYEQLTINDRSNEFKGFLADQKSIAYLPSGIEKCCGTIEVLMIKNSSLKDIASTNLKNFPGVIVLDLSFNKIQILEAATFDNNLKIQKLYLNGNQISAVALTVFDKLSKIKNLFMENNLCSVKKDSWMTAQQFERQFKGKENCINKENLIITQLMVKVEKVEANFQYIYTLSSNGANEDESNQISTINRIQNEIKELKSQSNHKELEDKIIQIVQNQSKYTELEKKIDQIELKWNQPNDKENTIEAKPEIPETLLYICSFLLLSILITLIIIICRNKGPSKTSNSSLKFQPVPTYDLTTVTQIGEDDVPVEPLPRDYNPLEPYDFYKSNELQSNASHNIPTFSNRSYANEIYGTTIVEDLYSEQISPKKVNNDEQVKEESELYAVISKPRRQ